MTLCKWDNRMGSCTLWTACDKYLPQGLSQSIISSLYIWRKWKCGKLQ